MKTRTARRPGACRLIAGALAAAAVPGASAQDFPTDGQVQAAFGTLYDHLGLLEYCAAKGYASAADVDAVRLEVRTVVAGTQVSPEARAREAQGRRGEVIGRQIVGLMRPGPAHPELVPEGRTATLADVARAQGITERALCGQMAAQEQAQTAGLRTR